MLLKKKTNFKKLLLKHFTKSELDLDKYIKSQSFTWDNKTIKVLLGHRQESLYPYLGIHTNHGIFYMQNGIPWLQKFSDIFAEHVDIETQDWLLNCALEKIDNSIFWPIEITGLSIHNSIEKNLIRLILKNISNNNIYASQKDWLNMFSQLSFNQNKIFNINKIPLKRNIVLGKQQLNYKQYSNLKLGNIILLNNSNFNLQSIGLFNIGSFAMEILYSNEQIIFQGWKTSMSNDKDFENDDWNLEEYDINDINDSEDNEYIEENTDIKEENLEATEEEASIENTTHPFANVPVNLSFSLGQLKLSIEEIMQLQEGTVLELEKSTPAQVNIYANGKNIGNGEVVEIDGKIGVQIINLYNN